MSNLKNDNNLSSINENDEQIFAYNTVIKILGAGGAGNNTLSRLEKSNLKSRKIETIAINTDAQDLLRVNAERKILIGRALTAGLGTGGDPAIGERSAEETRALLQKAIDGTDILFLTAGMGGGTGTGSLNVVAKLAKEMKILTIAIVSMPFKDEGIVRWENAQIGLEKLRKYVDTIIILRNDKLSEWASDLPLSEAFRAGDDILVNAILGISHLVEGQGIINVDFADISMILRDGPEALIGFGESNSDNREEEAVRRAISHPMMDSQIQGAQSALIHITGGPDMTLKQANAAVHSISKQLDPTARIIWGMSIEKDHESKMSIMMIIAGLKVIDDTDNSLEDYEEYDVPEIQENTSHSVNYENIFENERSIFDIKEAILSSGDEVAQRPKPLPKQPTTQTTLVFYKIFEEEAKSDLKRFDRSMHSLRQDVSNHRAILDARQSCKLLLASAKMFGFDEIVQLIEAIEEIFRKIQSKELSINTKILDSITLGMEMVVDLVENRSDGRGETGYIVDRLHEFSEHGLQEY